MISLNFHDADNVAGDHMWPEPWTCAQAANMAAYHGEFRVAQALLSLAAALQEAAIYRGHVQQARQAFHDARAGANTSDATDSCWHCGHSTLAHSATGCHANDGDINDRRCDCPMHGGPTGDGDRDLEAAVPTEPEPEQSAWVPEGTCLHCGGHIVFKRPTDPEVEPWWAHAACGASQCPPTSTPPALTYAMPAPGDGPTLNHQ